MNNKQRFNNIMSYQNVDRIIYFEEGIRKEVLKKWGIKKSDYLNQFKVDYREEIVPDVDPKPIFKKWPSTKKELITLKNRLNPNDSRRIPENFNKNIKILNESDYPIILRVHRGFFLSLGVYDNHRFLEVINLLIEDPVFIKDYMKIQGIFASNLAEIILKKIKVDAVFFSEPIGSNFNSLISPQMYEEFVLESYVPLLSLCDKYNIQTKIFLTYANASALIPSILKYGINCLWACEVNCKEMDYLLLRDKFGKDLRLIGGIDLDTLLHDKTSIKKEIMTKVPTLVEQGGYIPLADGRIRPNVPYENYVYYRNLIEEIIQSYSKNTS